MRKETWRLKNWFPPAFLIYRGEEKHQPAPDRCLLTCAQNKSILLHLCRFSMFTSRLQKILERTKNVWNCEKKTGKKPQMFLKMCTLSLEIRERREPWRREGGERKRCDGTHGSHSSFTPAFIHLRDTGKAPACSMPSGASVTEFAMRRSHAHTHRCGPCRSNRNEGGGHISPVAGYCHVATKLICFPNSHTLLVTNVPPTFSWHNTTPAGTTAGEIECVFLWALASLHTLICTLVEYRA